MTCVLWLGWCDAPLWAGALGMIALIGLFAVAIGWATGRVR